MKQRVVHFYSEGSKLEGDYFVPADQKPGERRPGIVLCHGYSGVQRSFSTTITLDLRCQSRSLRAGVVERTHRRRAREEANRALSRSSNRAVGSARCPFQRG
jgi:hypothetical protein